MESVQAVSTQPLKIEVIYPNGTAKFGIALSGQEQACILGIFLGRRNRQIAQSLNTTEQVVKNHLRLAYAKLGIHHDRELLFMVIQAQFELRTGQQVPTYAQ